MGALQLHVNNCSSFVSENVNLKMSQLLSADVIGAVFQADSSARCFVVVAAVICVVSASLSTSENIKTTPGIRAYGMEIHPFEKHTQTQTHTHTHTHTHTFTLILTHAHTRSALKWRSSRIVSRTGGTNYLFSLPEVQLFHNGHIYNNLHECDLRTKKHACTVSLFLNL